ncbi:hypothetical protein PG995_002591 [Apiospora arundinis]
MALPEWLRSKYYQYKKDTSIIASWIANTARSLGGKPGRVVEEEPSIPSAAEILAAAEEMGKKAEAEIAPPSKSKNPTYVLQIKEFIPMTQHIANTATATEPAIEVPSTLYPLCDSLARNLGPKGLCAEDGKPCRQEA